MKKGDNRKNLSRIISGLVEIQGKIQKLPELPDVEKTKIEHTIAIDQLYNSSKLEGTRLTDKRIDKAIFGYES